MKLHGVKLDLHWDHNDASQCNEVRRIVALFESQGYCIPGVSALDEYLSQNNETNNISMSRPLKLAKDISVVDALNEASRIEETELKRNRQLEVQNLRDGMNACLSKLLRTECTIAESFESGVRKNGMVYISGNFNDKVSLRAGYYAGAYSTHTRFSASRRKLCKFLCFSWKRKDSMSLAYTDAQEFKIFCDNAV